MPIRAMAAAAGFVLLGTLPALAAGAETGAYDPDIQIRVPAGFRATLFADVPGSARHMAASADGRVFVIQTGRRGSDGGVIALRDDDADGKADAQEIVSDIPGSGLAVRKTEETEWLYIGADDAIYRARLGEGLALAEDPELIVRFPEQYQHATKPMVFDGQGHMYVGIGAPSNACQQQMRTPDSPGMDPCPQLDLYGGLWRFDADTPGQAHGRDGERFATGIRNPFAIDWHRPTKRLLFAQHGRDDLHRLFPDHFTLEDNRDLPAEELVFASRGEVFGWPYTYWDGIAGARRLAPEYGGDGAQPPKTDYPAPLVAFPAHWAPNDLVIYEGDHFPQGYRGGAFVAFHGSWNRAPFAQEGYNVSFVPLTEAGERAGDWYVFADGFVGAPGITPSDGAAHRPTGLAVGPDGALYISDSNQGWIWRVVYVGD